MCMKAETKSDAPHVPRMLIELEVRDRDGKVIQRYKQEAKSFVWNFMSILFNLFSGSTTILFQYYSPAQGCVQQTQSFTSASDFSVEAPSGNDSYGILIGSGNAPNSPMQCALETKIPNSTMAYGSTSVSNTLSVNNNTNTITFTITRQFTNNSGSTQTVAEVGLAINGGNTYPLIARDVLSSSVSVPNGGTLTVTYTIELTVT